jgi:acetylornithine deacetylase/succinyl-diaminopimelate desuccinylase-like protein
VPSVCPDAEVRPCVARPPVAGEAGAGLVRLLRQAAGADPETVGVGYRTDAAIFPGAGIPAVSHGPAAAGAHEAVGWVDLDSVPAVVPTLVGAAEPFWAAGG